MEEPKKRYILLQDRNGKILEKRISTLGLASVSQYSLVSKGELLEALPENEQPGDTKMIALGGIDPKLRIECPKEVVKELTVQEADLLQAVSSPTLRLEIFQGKRLDFGKRLEHGTRVLVRVSGVSNKLPGVVRFRGTFSNLPGTMFGVELSRNPGLGTCDGTFENKEYFKCAPESAVFVGLDELEPLEDNSESALDSGKSDPKLSQPRNIDSLKIDQRVVTFGDEDIPLRGTVRYTGDVEDSRGDVQTLVGLELALLERVRAFNLLQQWQSFSPLGTFLSLDLRLKKQGRGYHFSLPALRPFAQAPCSL
ncbi:PREDICTED: ubiquitin carboxyl-terminal hydrolase CYLD-like [Acropora digitifera]|uniref:ubiquitin carboxyl-terminal hydrolase CYLD-like n=1 Tax=Acropora digitifera TaxID=70779 RepID=UPI00077A81A3|nr:PREDICTED: ubiquitin carboxyl-terminal hydrolase CYLD-like [Acropora digitifera]